MRRKRLCLNSPMNRIEDVIFSLELAVEFNLLVKASWPFTSLPIGAEAGFFDIAASLELFDEVTRDESD